MIPGKHKLPFVMPVEPDDDSLIMQDEIFGPMLSIKTYQSLDKVIEFINNKPRPSGALLLRQGQARDRGTVPAHHFWRCHYQ